jgi:hypothetical protein
LANKTRLYVKNILFEGWATETDYFPNELFPIQVELDEPDDDGHSLKRVGKADIIPNKEE